MPGFHSVTHVPSLQQAQTIVREQSLFSNSTAPDVEALKVAEFVDNYCEPHITTRFPEDLSRLLIAAFKAGQASDTAESIRQGGQLVRDLDANTKYIANQTDMISSAIYCQVATPLGEVRNWIAPIVALLLAALSGIIYIAIVVSR